MWSCISLFPLMVSTFCVLCKESFPISRHEDIFLCFLLALLFDLSHLDLQSILKLVFCLMQDEGQHYFFSLWVASNWPCTIIEFSLLYCHFCPESNDSQYSFDIWVRWNIFLWLVSICIYFSVNCPYFVTFLLGCWSFSFQFCETLYTLEILALCDINCRDVCVYMCIQFIIPRPFYLL